MHAITQIIKHFFPDRPDHQVEPFGTGNVNDTYLVTLDSPLEKVIFQRINPHVFDRPSEIMENMQKYIDHNESNLKPKVPAEIQSWEIPSIYQSVGQKPYFIDEEGTLWRAMRFIENSCTYDFLANEAQAKEVGYLLGYFHQVTHKMDASQMYDTLPGFHITPLYLEKYDQLDKHQKKQNAEIRHCIDFIETRRGNMFTLDNAHKKGDLTFQTIHGDPKVGNILFHRETDRGIGLIDLDTLKPGIIHYDLGDCLRSGCNLNGEDPKSLNEVEFDLDICNAILKSYLKVTSGLLTPKDREHLYTAIHTIPLELGLRFFTDFLAGNVYFKVKDEEHNLRRAMVQFQLTASIEKQQHKILEIIS